MSSGLYSGLAMHDAVQRYWKELMIAPTLVSSGKAERYVIPSFIGQLRGLPKSSVVVWNVCSNARRSVGGIAQWLVSFNFRPCGLRDLALGWYRAKSCRRYGVKSSDGRQRECAAYSHAYFSGEIKVGDTTVPVRVCNPIICFPVEFHGEKGGTREA